MVSQVFLWCGKTCITFIYSHARLWDNSLTEWKQKDKEVQSKVHRMGWNREMEIPKKEHICLPFIVLIVFHRNNFEKYFIFSSWRVLQIFFKNCFYGRFYQNYKKGRQICSSWEFPSLPCSLPIPSHSVATCSVQVP